MAKYLTDRDDRKLQAVVRAFNNSPELQALAASNPQTGPPQVALAKTDLAKYDLGTFDLQKGKPDAYVLSGETRQAYALCDMKQGDAVELEYKVGADSGGYWTAAKCGGTPGPTGSGCVCALIQLLIDETVLTPAAALPLQIACGCELPDTVACSNCLDGLAPASIDVTLSVAWGTSADALANDLGIDWAAVLNTTHTIEIIENTCSGTVRVDTGLSTEEDSNGFIPVGTPTEVFIKVSFSQSLDPDIGIGYAPVIETTGLANVAGEGSPRVRFYMSRSAVPTADPYPCQLGADFSLDVVNPSLADWVELLSASYVQTP